jgi:hypothetical protein
MFPAEVLPSRPDVQEDVLAAILRLNEAEAFSRVKPFHGASGHIRVSFVVCRARNAAAVAVRSIQKDRQPARDGQCFPWVNDSAAYIGLFGALYKG